MDPVTSATSFATIVGLLAEFKKERNAASDDEYGEFLQWLDAKRHRELMEEIGSNQLLGLGIKHTLEDSHSEVIEKLTSLETSMLKIASALPGFNEIASAILPSSELSSQAISILEQLDESGGSRFLEIKTFGGTEYIVMDAPAGGSIEVEDARFAESDLNELCSFGFLIPDRNSKGDRLWHFTREAANLLKVRRK